jgi:proteasome lid subunit RPN8/RPN11
MLAAGARLRDGTPLARPEAWDALRAHAVAEYPRECIGYVSQAGLYVPFRNTSPDPLRFAVPDKAQLAAAYASRDLRALCHSHPDGPDCPTETDMRTQHEMDVPFAIVSTNGTATAAPFAWGDDLLDDEPLVGRGFRHATRDCYSIIRSWYERERGVLLPDFPRSWEWWTADHPGSRDLYRRHFADAGFREVDRRDARDGDVWLAAVRSTVPNHAGLWLDGGVALHHPCGGQPCDPAWLSRREPFARWTPWVTHWLRRDEACCGRSGSTGSWGSGSGASTT